MKPFDQPQKKIIGAAYVLEKLQPRSPYGKEAARALSPFAKNEKTALEMELQNTAKSARIITEDEKAHNDILRILVRFRDIRGSINKLGTQMTLGDVELFEVKGFLLDLSELISCFNTYNKKAHLEGLSFEPMDEALTILDPEGGRLRAFYLSALYSDELGRIRQEKSDIESRIHSGNGNQEELLLKRLEIVSREDKEELAVRETLTRKLSQYKILFLDDIKNIARLDLVLAKAVLAYKGNCVLPIITDNSIELTDMYNPEVNEALETKGGSMTPVSLKLSPGTCIITGANMGGKSVALKTLALNAYLFQCGLLVYAKYAKLPIFDCIDFIFDDKADVWAGLSSFGAEMAEIGNILNRAKESFSLIILDEPARGTNPKEGRAVASALAKRLNGLSSISVIATHYDNVASKDYRLYMAAGLRKDLLSGLNNLTPEMIPELMDYRLIESAPGQAVPKDALTICKLLGLDRELLDLIDSP